MPFPWVQFMTKQINKKNKETKQNKAGPISQLNKTQASPRIAARYMKWSLHRDEGFKRKKKKDYLPWYISFTNGFLEK